MITDASIFVGACDVGLGVFAARDLAPGQTILIFRGPRVEHDDPIHHTPLGANLLQTGTRTYIMPEPPGVLVNHSCDPNAGLVGNRHLVALRPIAAGQEIRYDYSTTMADGLWSLACRCGAPGCRRTVGDFRDLPPEVRDRYLRLGAVQGFIARGNRSRPPDAARTAAGLMPRERPAGTARPVPQGAQLRCPGQTLISIEKAPPCAGEPDPVGSP